MNRFNVAAIAIALAIWGTTTARAEAGDGLIGLGAGTSGMMTPTGIPAGTVTPNTPTETPTETPTHTLTPLPTDTSTPGFIIEQGCAIAADARPSWWLAIVPAALLWRRRRPQRARRAGRHVARYRE